MIIDRIERLGKYQAILGKINKALTEVKNRQNDFQEGKQYAFDGGFIFFQTGQTKPLQKTQFESHKKFIDVQLLLKGAEYVALEDLSQLTTSIPYNSEKDVEKYDGGTNHFIKITEGMAYVCFPWDGHKAVFHLEESLSFTKAVIKLEI